MNCRNMARRVCVGLLLLIFSAAPLRAQHGTKSGEWPAYGGDWGSTKYSPLDQINRDNASQLKIAWVWESPDKEIVSRRLGRTEYTPVMVGGTLYTSTSLSQAAAIDAKTGEQLWVFNPESNKAGRPTNLGYTHRGLAYWSDGSDQRVYLATLDAYLWALDAKTGKPIASFGDGGKVDLVAAIPLATRSRNYAVSSPPVICKDVVVVGASISDGPQTKEFPRGDIQAFHAKTGKPAWTFHSIPQQGEFGNETWENDAWKYTGNTNVWTCMTADPELGYVYLPFGTPTNDWYGGHRHGDGLFAESLVCLDATNGKRVWHFQTVHHGVWDYDLPSPPVLCNIKVDGREIKAVAQPTKSGFLFVFDRTNGKPVWPIEERAVPPSKVPGEKLSATQPFPTKPAPFEMQGATEENLIDFTPELLAEAKEILNTFEHGGLFTPPSEKGTINVPGWAGGANWWGAAFDPETGMMYIPSINSPIVVALVKPDGNRSNFNYIRGGGRQLKGPRDLPLFKPPYGRITAIDMNTGEHAWMVPHGDGQRQKISQVVGRDVGPVGIGGQAAATGPLLTKTLLFIGQGHGTSFFATEDTSQVPNVIRAFDKQTGKVLAEIAVPAMPTGTPMTYMVDGRQYIVTATSDNKLVALSLPGN